ncbi:MAG: hypothetical protein RL568_446 [Actinomycetota bacterium]
MFASSSGIAIKRVVALVLALFLLAPAAGAAQSTELAATKKKTTKVTPSPSPVWPPKGFVKSKDGNTFAKIPTAKELVGLASNDKALTRALARQVDGIPVCEKFSCGAVQVASLTGCTWWVVTANVRGATSAEDPYATILIISQEPIELEHSVASIKASCRKDVPQEKVPGTTYTVTP